MKRAARRLCAVCGPGCTAPSTFALRATVDKSAALELAAVDQVTEPADAIEDRAFLQPSALRLRRGGVDAIGHAAERQRLQPDAARPLQRGEEDAFAAEQRRLDAADELDVVVHARLQRHQTAGVDAQRFTRLQIEVLHVAAGVHEAQPVALELLHDEASAAEQA